MNSLKNMSKRDQVILAALAGIVVLVLYYVFLLSPQMQKLSDVRNQVEEEKQKLISNQLTIKRLREIQIEAAKTEIELIRLRKLLPPEVELPSLIVQMSDTVVQSGLKWPNVRPGEPLSVQEYTVYPVQFTFKGNFLDFLDFLYRLYRFPRLLTINGIQMTQKKEQIDGNAILQLEVIMDANVYLSQRISQGGSAPQSGSPQSGNAQSAQPGGGG